MGKTIKKRTLSPLKIILIILAVVIGLPIIFVLGTIAVSVLILQPIDKAKFESLDKNSRALFATVQQISNNSEPWVYDASCEPERAGPWATGSYYCTTELSFEEPVTDAITVSALNTKYFPSIDNASWLTPQTELSTLPVGDFGVNFVVSGAEKSYLTEGDVRCNYLAKIGQAYNESNELDYTYGSQISGGEGRALISLSCTEITSGDWYAL